MASELQQPQQTLVKPRAQFHPERKYRTAPKSEALTSRQPGIRRDPGNRKSSGRKRAMPGPYRHGDVAQRGIDW